MITKKYFLAIIILSIAFSLVLLSQENQKYWIYFKDKGKYSQQTGILQKGAKAYSLATQQITESALKRRAKVLPVDQLVDYQDLPLNESYIKSIQQTGGILQQKVRWMNAASFFLSTDQIIQIQNLPFVEAVKPVARFYRKDLINTREGVNSSFQKTLGYDYGLSWAQYAAVKIPEVHELGINGEGVLVGMLDTGFRWRLHESLKNTNVIAERDFINNDDTTANQTGDPNEQDLHGTLTMSIVGSYMPGKVIGPAFKSDFILAKTEYVPTETQIEEDWWAAGIEWMESRGADVVSSSLGYNIFDNGQGYRWENGDFDGKTGVTTKAATRAARLGVVVVTAMGNESNGNGVRGTLMCPADADSILSVGAITIAGNLATFSSTGPTNDGRVKPDVVAPGVSVYSGVIPGPSTYGYSQGTSASTPITAGVAALLLSARPELTPVQVREALRNTADRVEVSRFPTHPNNFVGWGRVNALKAIYYPSIHKSLNNYYYIANYVGKAGGILGDSVYLVFSYNMVSYDTLKMDKYFGSLYSSNGTYRIFLPSISVGAKVSFYIIAVDSTNQLIRFPQDSSKAYLFTYGSTQITLDTLKQPQLPTKFELTQNYPNPFPTPFNPGTTIRFDSPNSCEGTIIIYNLLGEKVLLLHNGLIREGINYFYWNTQNHQGVNVPSGVYFYQIRTNSFIADRKMVLIR
ncbi:MAG: S8 family serine peptidase [Bacteroidota bacterium]|nr:S8 family serine peptidase [Bacteroidota bacterium]